MSDDDFFITAQTKLRTTLADAFKEISALKNRNSSLKAENSELKFRNKDLCEALKDTQVDAGGTWQNANRRQVRSTTYSLDVFIKLRFRNLVMLAFSKHLTRWMNDLQSWGWVRILHPQFKFIHPVFHSSRFN
jgi:regulator of replication initiation timing